MNISDVAKITGLTSKAIRFYEEKGLLPPPPQIIISSMGTPISRNTSTHSH